MKDNKYKDGSNLENENYKLLSIGNEISGTLNICEYLYQTQIQLLYRELFRQVLFCFVQTFMFLVAFFCSYKW